MIDFLFIVSIYFAIFFISEIIEFYQVKNIIKKLKEENVKEIIQRNNYFVVRNKAIFENTCYVKYWCKKYNIKIK